MIKLKGTVILKELPAFIGFGEFTEAEWAELNTMGLAGAKAKAKAAGKLLWSSKAAPPAIGSMVATNYEPLTGLKGPWQVVGYIEEGGYLGLWVKDPVTGAEGNMFGAEVEG